MHVLKKYLGANKFGNLFSHCITTNHLCQFEKVSVIIDRGWSIFRNTQHQMSYGNYSLQRMLDRKRTMLFMRNNPLPISIKTLILAMGTCQTPEGIIWYQLLEMS